jgi:hypothetical protein
VEIFRRRTPSSTPHPSPDLGLDCAKPRATPSPTRGEGKAAPPSPPIASVGELSKRRCQTSPSPLVGEGGSALSAETDEGCWTERRPQS